ncbi:MAG TPA: ATP-binding protein, partial [Rhodocyclaceae bacterium]|nr:ATP-binding protein [Rhodocyclaceae bacterium]
VLSVANTGETIAAEQLPRLFDRFYRVDASRQRHGEGAGLGLAITRSIAHAHGGEALVRSEAGVTSFELRLPV